MSRPTMRFVPPKSAEAQARLMLLKVRETLVRQRTRIANTIRGHAAEFGFTAPVGLAHLAPLLSKIAAAPALPDLALALFSELGHALEALEARIGALEARLKAAFKADPAAQRLAAIPGVGPIGALMLTLKTPAPAGFASGRDFAAWLGLTPRDHSTAGKQRLGGITRAGDEGLRAVLVTGATARLRQLRRGAGAGDPWLEKLLQRKSPKQVAVALANKIARIAWKLLVSAEPYRPGPGVASAPAR
jgi:transposase